MQKLIAHLRTNNMRKINVILKSIFGFKIPCLEKIAQADFFYVYTYKLLVKSLKSVYHKCFRRFL